MMMVCHIPPQSVANCRGMVVLCLWFYFIAYRRGSDPSWGVAASWIRPLDGACEGWRSTWWHMTLNTQWRSRKWNIRLCVHCYQWFHPGQVWGGENCVYPSCRLTLRWCSLMHMTWSCLRHIFDVATYCLQFYSILPLSYPNYIEIFTASLYRSHTNFSRVVGLE